MFTLIPVVAAMSVGAVQDPADFEPVTTVSNGEAFTREKVLIPEKPNLLVFYQESSSADKELVEQISARAREARNVAVRLIKLKNLDQPAARENEVKETPTLVVLDRFGNELVKTSKIEEIHLALKKAVGMARIKWVSEDDPEAATVYRMAGGGKQGVPGIIKTMSLRPQWMEMVFGLAQMSHFRDGALPRKTKEMIATYVSAINHCKF